MSKIQLNTSCILKVPLQTYEQVFSFVVNGVEFKTARLVSDLISPIISNIHMTDSTFDSFTINTSNDGDFSLFLELVKFNVVDIPEDQIPFISEVIEILGNDSIDVHDGKINTEITVENAFSIFFSHEKYAKFYSKRSQSEIDFISSHFSELCEQQEDSFKKLKIDDLLNIIKSPKLQLTNEDQLLKFVNQLYKENSKYSILYEHVYFLNVTLESMKEFIRIFNYDDMTNGVWSNISDRLIREINNTETKDSEKNKRYKNQTKKRKEFLYNGNNQFSGIIDYLRKESNNQIENKINFSSSSIYSSNYVPINSSIFDNDGKVFETKHDGQNWICFDFNEYKIVPSNYTIRSIKWGHKNWYHPKSWVIEGSNDNNSWEIITEEKNCSFLNGEKLIHTFDINNNQNKEFRYIRMKLTEPNWGETHFLGFDSFEIFGILI